MDCTPYLWKRKTLVSRSATAVSAIQLEKGGLGSSEDEEPSSTENSRKEGKEELAALRTKVQWNISVQRWKQPDLKIYGEKWLSQSQDDNEHLCKEEEEDGAGERVMPQFCVFSSC